MKQLRTYLLAVQWLLRATPLAKLGIFLILQNKKNWPVWQTDLAKIETWQNSPPLAYMRVPIVVAIVVSL
jgi:hypothetical protein